LSDVVPNLTYTPNTGFSGSDSFTFKANDGQTDSNIATVNIIVTPSTGNTITVPVIQGSDDAGIDNACSYFTTSNETYFGQCSNGSLIISGFRFQNVQIPAGATINEAHLEFTVDGPYTSVIVVKFFGQRSENSTTFTNTDRPDNRPLTATFVPWTISDPWSFGQSRSSPNLASIIQEIVNLPGWASGNALTIITKSDSAVPSNTARRVYGWEREKNSNHTARLVVNYTLNQTSFVSGKVIDANNNPISGITISDGAGHTAATDANGNYTLPGLTAGTYTLTPGKTGYTFSPASRSVTVPPNASNMNFTGTPPPPNRSPVANSQTVTTPQNTPKSITLTASDADGDPLTYILVSNPANGQLSGTIPNFTYTPTNGFSGSDSFTFKVNDGKTDSNVATVSITVTPQTGNYTCGQLHKIGPQILVPCSGNPSFIELVYSDLPPQQSPLVDGAYYRIANPQLIQRDERCYAGYGCSTTRLYIILDNDPYDNWEQINSCDVSCSGSQAPIADFTASPVSGNAPLNVSFQNNSTGNITSCIWDYGDGETRISCASNHHHIYIAAGTYKVTLTMSGPGGSNSQTRNSFITVFAPSMNCSDRDRDGLCDDWELHGHNGVDLPAMGADPDRPDIFVEIDYMQDPGPGCIKTLCWGHRHQPDKEAIDLVINAFNLAGINLHVDNGPESTMRPLPGVPGLWGALSHSNPLPDVSISSLDKFSQFKDDNFRSERRGIFHYAVYAHDLQIPQYPNVGGIGEIPGDIDNIFEGSPGDDLIILNTFDVVIIQAGKFMHELGHNLGLRHGGDDDLNNKPNYLSIMNYLFAFKGLWYNGEEGKIDYSSAVLPALKESHLNENFGINGSSSTTYGTRWHCPSKEITYVEFANAPIDWNCDSVPGETNIIPVDINGDLVFTGTFEGYSDWNKLVYIGGDIGKSSVLNSFSNPRILSNDRLLNEPPKDLWKQQPSPYWVNVTGPGEVLATPGIEAMYSFTIQNLGNKPDAYTLTVSSRQGWADLHGVPANISLSPGESQEISISVTLPQDAEAGIVDELKVIATSQGSPDLFDVASARTVISKVIYLPLIQK